MSLWSTRQNRGLRDNCGKDIKLDLAKFMAIDHYCRDFALNVIVWRIRKGSKSLID